MNNVTKLTCRTLVLTVTAVATVLSTHAQAAVGRTQGTHSVSPSGAAVYRIPLWISPGAGGVQPSLTLSYDSQTGGGIAGPGWSLTGLSAIIRCNKTFAQDTALTSVTLTYDDAFCLDGQRLRLTSSGGLGTYGQPGTTYDTESATFSQVTALGASGNGPQSFEVKAKNGWIYEFGNTADSRVTPSASVPTAYMWLVNRVRDRAGNSYVVTYGTGSAGSSGIAVPMSISYSPSTAGGTTYLNSVIFEYGPKAAQTPGAIDTATVGYVNGIEVTNTNLLLRVNVYSSGTLTRRYVAGYEAAPTTVRARLARVTECAGNNESDCLLPTTISYNNGASGVIGASTLALTQHALQQRVDINGDGRDDLVLLESEAVAGGYHKLRVAFSNGSGFTTPVTVYPDIPYTYTVADFTGAGKHDFLISDSPGSYVRYTWNGNQFASSSFSLPVATPYSWGIGGADVNGDGRDDLIYAYKPSKNGSSFRSVYLSSSSNGVMTFEPAVDFSGIGETETVNTPNELLDFDGDGLRDSISTSLNTKTGVRTVAAVMSRGLTAVSSGSKALAGLGLIIGYARINDDACSDIIADAAVYISPCNGQAPITVGLSGSALGAMDWNSDGRMDVLVQNGTTFGVLLSTGASFAPMLATSIPVSTESARNVFIADIDGDGQHDLGTWSTSGMTVYKHASAGLMPDLVASITDGYGVSVSYGYASNADRTETQYANAAYPERDYRGPLTLVSSLTATSGATDGSLATYTRSFSYYGARRDVTGRGFLGFSQIRTIDNRNSLVRDVYMRTAFPLTGRIFRNDVQQTSSGPLVSRTTFGQATIDLDPSTNNRRVFAYTNSTQHQLYEVGGSLNGAAVKTTNQSTSYDSYGNAISTVTTVTDSQTTSQQYGQQWTSTVTNTINPDTSNWCLGLPSQTTVTNAAPNVPSLTQTTAFNVDYAACRVTQQIKEPGNARWQVSTGFGFDGFGNIDSVTTTPIGQPARTSTISWSTYAGRFPDSVTQPVTSSTSYATAFGWDAARGVRTSVTDPNGLQTQWVYDAFGQLVRETHPDGTRTAYARTACDSSNSYCGSSTLRSTVATTLRDPSDHVLRTDYLYFDQFDRPQRALQQLLGAAYSQISRTYDAFGRLSTESFPRLAGEPSPVTAYSYDLVGRLTRVRRPTSATDTSNHDTTWDYAGLSVAQIDALNHTTIQRYNAAALVAQAIDAAGSNTDYEYDAFGRLIKTRDVLGNEIVLTYSVRGLKLALSDPDLGYWQYDYFPTGELKQQVDAKSQTLAFTYDYLSRPVTRIESEGTTTWSYGNSAANHNVGQLVSVTSPGYSESYTYDAVGRLDNLRIVSDSTYDYDYTYDAATGELGTVEYPTSTSNYRLKLQYGYQNGALYQIRDANGSTVFWQANSMNPLGQITQQTLGNGVVTHRSFDLVTGLISGLQSGVGAGAALQNESYLFDKVGNLIQRQQNQLGLTENFYYDSLYRLDYSTLGGSTNLDLAYDAIGNIIHRSDLGDGTTWTYHATKKHAVVQAGPNTYSYDANGNAQTRNGQSIEWTSYNYPRVINGPGKTMTFDYGPDRQRYRQVYTNGSLTETTIYAGGALEKVNVGNVTDYRHYIFADRTAVAIVSRRSDGVNATRYLLSDHLGSIARILNEDGTTFASESFEAFGGRRDADTWSGPCPCPVLSEIASISRRGFTGHEMIGGHSMGLIHMNGRVYDSQIGRFISADSYIPDPLNAQSFNRYSYVRNNPLSLVDPTGHWDFGFHWGSLWGWARWAGGFFGWGSSDSGESCFRKPETCRSQVDRGPTEGGGPGFDPVIRHDLPDTPDTGQPTTPTPPRPDRPPRPRPDPGPRASNWDSGLAGPSVQASGELNSPAQERLVPVYVFNDGEGPIYWYVPESEVAAVEAQLTADRTKAIQILGGAFSGSYTVRVGLITYRMYRSYQAGLPHTRAVLEADLVGKGFVNKGTSAGGYTTYRHPDGRTVTIKPTGEVIPTRPAVSQSGTRYNARTDYNFERIPDQSHSTGHYVEPLEGGSP